MGPDRGRQPEPRGNRNRASGRTGPDWENAAWEWGNVREPSNKAMKLTKLSAALWYGRHGMHVGQVPPRARAASMDAGTASQLIASVLPTCSGRST